MLNSGSLIKNLPVCLIYILAIIKEGYRLIDLSPLFCITQGAVLNDPSSCIPHNDNLARWAGLKERDWPKVTHPASMSKGGLVFAVSQFLQAN